MPGERSGKIDAEMRGGGAGEISAPFSGPGYRIEGARRPGGKRSRRSAGSARSPDRAHGTCSALAFGFVLKGSISAAPERRSARGS
jgi:hypothetical protein